MEISCVAVPPARMCVFQVWLFHLHVPVIQEKETGVLKTAIKRSRSQIITGENSHVTSSRPHVHSYVLHVEYYFFVFILRYRS